MISPRTEHLIALALEEDAGLGDVTSRAIFPARHRSRGYITAGQELSVCGVEIAARVFSRVDPALKVTCRAVDGDRLQPGDRVLDVTGPTAALLTAERTALNFLQRLSGIATLARRYADAMAGTGVRIVDTRKTTPGWRELEKYAVRCGGGINHRFGLDDAILIKDNHVAACGGVAEALRRAQASAGHLTPIEVEVDSLAQLEQALPFAPAVIMLDNFSLEDLRRAVAIAGGRVRLEASGGVSLQTVRAIAETGVDVISVGALTHSAPVLDIGLDAA